MKLKNILLGAASAIAIFTTVACQNIDPEDRLIPVDKKEVGRAVLIEDFTGQRCPNCPKGTEAIEAITARYGSENVIAVGIHSGPLGFDGNSKNLGLTTATGKEYYKHWDSQGKIGQPWALINRVAEPNSDYNSWATYVTALISKPAALSIEISNAYDATTRNVTIDVDALGVNGTLNGKLQVWLIEDGIVAMQTQPDGKVDKEYVHNHVFRATVNDMWGDAVTINENEHTKKQYTYTLPEAWNAEKVSVVAFVYDDTEVQQVAKKAVVAE